MVVMVTFIVLTVALLTTPSHSLYQLTYDVHNIIVVNVHVAPLLAHVLYPIASWACGKQLSPLYGTLLCQPNYSTLLWHTVSFHYDIIVAYM